MIKAFDFSKLKKISSRQLAMTETLFRLYPQCAAKNFSEIWAAFEDELKIDLPLNYVSLEEAAYSEFIEALPSSPLVAVFRVEPYEQEALLELDPVVSRMLVYHALGQPFSARAEAAPLTPSEEGVLTFLLLKFLALLAEKEGMQGFVSVRFLKLHSESKSLLGSLRDESGCVAKFSLGVGQRVGYLRVYLPHPLLEGVSLPEEDFGAAEVDPAQLAQSVERIAHIKTTLWLEVGRVSLLASEKAQLEPGDVVLFDESFANMGPHGLCGKSVLRVGDFAAQGLIAEVIDSDSKAVVKILDY